MRHRSARNGVCALAMLAVLWSAGCSADDEPTAEETPTVGTGELVADTCFAGETLADAEVLALVAELEITEIAAVRALPTYDDPIDCAKPHLLEVYAVVDAPKGADDYAAALDPTAEQHQAVRSSVAAACRDEADPVLAGAADASPLDLVPMPAFADGIRVDALPFPHARWAAGEEKFACVLRQEEARAVRYADFRDPQLDPALRICQDAGLETVACDAPHTRERLLLLDASPAVAAEQLPGRDAVDEDDGGTWVDLRDEAYQLLDAECTAYFAVVADDPDPGLTAVAEILPEMWGDENGRFTAVCTVSSPLSVGSDDMVETSRSVVD